MGERDFAWMRRNCTTLRDPGDITADMDRANEEIRRDRNRALEDQEYDAAGYYHAGIRREAEESGIAYATPAQMAKVFGGEPWMYDENYSLSEA